jgi:hypothetical protein
VLEPLTTAGLSASMRIDHVIYGTADLVATAMRLKAELGLRPVDSPATTGSGRATGSSLGRTELTGVAELLAEPCLPFFIERGATQAAPRAADTTGICGIEVAGDARRLRHWLGGVELPVRVVEGPPAVRAVGVGEHELRTG